MAQILLFITLVFMLALLVTVLLHIVFRVPYVPSQTRVVKRMMRLSGLKPNERVYDLGCGDGRLLLAAEKKGALAEGFEIAPLVYLLGYAKKLICRSRVKLHFKNFFSIDLKNANVIFCYLLPGALKKLSSKLQRQCRKGARIVSNSFRIPVLTPKKILRRQKKRDLPTVYLYQI